MIITWSIAESQGILTNKDAFDFTVASGSAGEIMQNVRTILTTRKGTQQLDRKFGFSYRFQDRPINNDRQGALLLMSEAALEVHKYEPRVLIEDFRFDFSDAANGHIDVTVLLKVLTAEPYQGSWQPL